MGHGRNAQIGRTEPPVPMATTKAERERIAKCEVTKATAPSGREFNHIYDVRRDGTFLGQVRDVMGRQLYRVKATDQWLSAGHEWNEKDPHHCLAIIQLLRMTWCVYIVRCSDGTYYTGATNNLDKRLLTHNKGKGAKYTKKRLPVALVATVDGMTKSEALSLEWHVKKQPRNAKIAFLKSKE